MTSVTVDDVPDHVLERVLNSRGFRKMVQYQHLAKGITALEEDGDLKDDLVSRITNQHSTVNTRASITEVLDLLVTEVRAFTEPMTEEADEDPVETDELEDLFIDEDEGDSP